MQTATLEASERLTRVSTPHFQLGTVYPAHGGVYAGLVRAPAGQPDWHLFVPTDPAAEFTGKAWGGYGKSEPGAESLNDGFANTVALVASKHEHPAAVACRAVMIDGLNDFYLPAKGEIAICFANVPELFEKAWYWSSTQYAGSHSHAWGQYFGNGGQLYGNKDYEGRCRAVRRLVI